MDFLHYLEEANESHSRTLDNVRRFKSAQGRLRRILTVLSRFPSATDVESVNLSTTYDQATDASIAVYLSEKRQTSTLLRDIVKAFHVPGRKSPQWNGKTLSCAFEINRVQLTVYGYKPTSCKVVTEEVIEEVKDARIAEDGKVYRTTVKSRVVCDPPESEERNE